MAERRFIRSDHEYMTTRRTTHLTSSQHHETLGLSLGSSDQQSAIKLHSLTICDSRSSSLVVGSWPLITVSMIDSPLVSWGNGSLSVMTYGKAVVGVQVLQPKN